MIINFNEQPLITKNKTICFACLFALFLNTHSVFAGGKPPIPVEATEITQRLNHAELIALVAKETEGVSLNAKQLAQQVALVKTQTDAYKNMVQNTLNLPETLWRDVESSLQELHGLMSEAQSLASEGGQLDKLLSSKLITDPFYKTSSIQKGDYEERYNSWNKLSQSALNATLSASRMTIKDVTTEAQLLNRIKEQGKSVKGQVEAIQIGNELASSVAQQLTKLRTITAAQNEQTSIFQARWLASMDAEEAQKRHTIKRADAIEEKRAPGKELIGSFTQGAQ